MISEDKVKEYWQQRYRKQKDKTVGYSGSLEGYSERVKWVGNELLRHGLLEFKTLDYGCGTGMYSNLFYKSKYLGVDITKELLLHTPNGYNYTHIQTPYLEKKVYDAEMIYTNCVLQHNSDELLRKILHGFTLQNPSFLVFYECTDKRIINDHVKPRQYSEYDNLVLDTFGLDFVQKGEIVHTFKGELHSLMIWERL